MILDTEQQRTIILTIIGQTNFPGQALDSIYALKQAVVGAKVVAPNLQVLIANNAAGASAEPTGPTGEPGATGAPVPQPAAPASQPGLARVQAAKSAITSKV